MSASQIKNLISDFNSSFHDLEDALFEMQPEEWDFSQAPEKWSPRMILHHITDSTAIAAIRLKKILAEPNPLLQAYDQEHWANSLFYSTLPFQPALRQIQSTHDLMTSLFEQMTEEKWERKGNHEETGEYNLIVWLESYIQHFKKHADQIRRARNVFAVEKRGE